jgi:hypothetical protein
MLLWSLRQPRTADLAAQVYRADLFHRVGWVLWDNDWFDGHVLPGYSLLTPWLMAKLGVSLTGLIAAAVTTLAFAAIVRCLRPRWPWPTASVAWAAAGDLLIGRVTYAVGLAFAVLAVLAVLALLRGRHLVFGCVLAGLSAGASPSPAPSWRWRSLSGGRSIATARSSHRVDAAPPSPSDVRCCSATAVQSRIRSAALRSR